jgi:hypothetical protein
VAKEPCCYYCAAIGESDFKEMFKFYSVQLLSLPIKKKIISIFNN